MKSYYIKQKVSMRDNYYVYDTNKEPCLQIKSRNPLLTGWDRLFGGIISLGNKIHIQHLDGSEAITIKKRIGIFNEKYDLYNGENKLATMTTHVFSLKPKITIASQNGDYSIKSNIMARKITFYKNNRTLADIKKVFFSLTDGYNIQIYNDSEEFICLAFLIVFDNSYHN